MFEVQEVQNFSDAIDVLRPTYSRIDDAISIAKVILQSNADRFPGVIGQEWRYLRTRAFPGIPPLAIVFRIEDGIVYLLRADLCGDDE